MSAADVLEALERNYQNGIRYKVANCYFFGYGYGETDLLLVKEPKGFIYDIEIKISRADFRRDMLKLEKHEILRSGGRITPHDTSKLQPDGTRKKYSKGEHVPADRPNRFYFAVPAAMVYAKDVPTYAGLLWIHEGGRVQKVKEAPLLHKAAVECESKLCKKFYYYWLQSENDNRILKNQIERLKQ